MERSKEKRLRSGFTLIELLVVIAIIGILIALLLPAVQKVRDAASRVKCSNNLKQLGVALHNYHSVNDAFPKGAWYGERTHAATNSANDKGNTWLALLLPYIEENNLYSQLNLDITVVSGTGSNNPQNAARLVERGAISTLLCPASPLPPLTGTPIAGNRTRAGICIPSYAGVSGGYFGSTASGSLQFQAGDGRVSGKYGMISIQGCLICNVSIKIKDVIDGTSSTLMVVEQSDWGKNHGQNYDIRSSAGTGGFLGCGIVGIPAYNPMLALDWDAHHHYTSASALTTVRWPVNYKDVSSPPGTTFDTYYRRWDPDSDPTGPTTFSGL